MPKIQITIVPKQIGQIFDTILDDLLEDLIRRPVSHGTRPLKQLIPNHYYPNYNVYQGKCYQQHTSNFCGYHATFNALCCLHMYLNLQSQYVIDSGASFWKFKKKVQKFLLQIKNANKLQDKWPWRINDILYGDFERTYNKICIQLFDDFDIFRQNHQNFTYMNFTWQFQYENLIISEQGRNQLNKKISYFQNYKGEKPLIFGIMLGITCHWTVLMAFKRNGKTQYWYFDSNNDHVLDYNQDQIVKYIDEYQQERQQKKKPKLTNFEREKFTQAVKDSQISIRLIIDCLQGKDSIDRYAYNQAFNVFAKPLQYAVNTQDKAIFSQTIKDYWYNISAFFTRTFFGKSQINWELLSGKSKERLQKLFYAAKETKQYSIQTKRFHQMLNSHNLQKGFF